jgi:hypothetical protein
MQSCSVKIINRVLLNVHDCHFSESWNPGSPRAVFRRETAGKSGRVLRICFLRAALIMTSLATNHPDIFTDERLKNMLRQELTNII